MTIQHTRTAIASGTSLTLGVAVAVALGVVPRVAGADSTAAGVTRAAASRPAVAHLAPQHAGHLVTRHATAHLRGAVPAAPSTRAPSAPTPGASSGATDGLIANLTVAPAAPAAAPAAVANLRQAHHRHHHHKRHHHKKHHKPAPTPTLAERTTPTSAQVSSAIAGLRQYVNSPFTPTASQVAQFGNDVCTAFDQGHTYSAVITEVQQKVHQIPFTSLKAGGADYVVKTAVSLYCPGYASKVS